MDYMYYGDGLNYYHNYNNITNMDMYSIVNINEAPYGNSIYLKDKIMGSSNNTNNNDSKGNYSSRGSDDYYSY